MEGPEVRPHLRAQQREMALEPPQPGVVSQKVALELDSPERRSESAYRQEMVMQELEPVPREMAQEQEQVARRWLRR